MNESSKFGATRTSVSGSTNGIGNKPSKPFCSLAYLAKSTVAINGNGIINGINNCNKKIPNVAATAKVSKKSTSPALPTEGAITNNGYEDEKENALNGHHSRTKTLSETNRELEALNKRENDIFGEINEEQKLCCDEVDSTAPTAAAAAAAADIRRPWEISTNSYVKRVPTALMTGSIAQNGGGVGGGVGFNGHGNSLTSLSSKLNSIDCWDYTIELECLKGPQDLQLAAELGKTLLERNKELETLLKEHKTTIDEQEQEIVYLKKHTTALREVNDSRLKVYEQLEVGIQDLERANHRLLVENTNDKKHIKTLTHNIENLEARCDELNKSLEETRQALSMERRKNERLLQNRNSSSSNEFAAQLKSTSEPKSLDSKNASSSILGYEPNTSAPENCSFAFQSPSSQRKQNSTGVSGSEENERSLDLSIVCSGEDSEEIIKLVNDLETTKRAFMAEQQRCTELEEQLVAIIQENQTLQSRIAQSSTNDEMKSMHDELSILDEVRQGQMCSRCLRSCVDDRATVNDEQSSIAQTEDDDERSMLDDNASELSQALGDSSAYRTSATIKATNTTTTTSTIKSRKSKCPWCPPSIAAKKTSTKKYLQKQTSLSLLETLFFDVWRKTLRKFKLMRWIAKILHWPSSIIYRMMSSIPDEDDFASIF